MLQFFKEIATINTSYYEELRLHSYFFLHYQKDTSKEFNGITYDKPYWHSVDPNLGISFVDNGHYNHYNGYRLCIADNSKYGVNNGVLDNKQIVLEYHEASSSIERDCRLVITECIGKRKFGITTLKIYRQFYFTYPQIVGEIANFIKLTISNGQSLTDQSIRQSVIAQLQLPENVQFAIGQSVTDQLVKVKNTNVSFLVKPYLLFNKLSFTHLAVFSVWILRVR